MFSKKKKSTRTSSTTPESDHNRPFRSHNRKRTRVAFIHLHVFIAHNFFVAKQF